MEKREDTRYSSLLPLFNYKIMKTKIILVIAIVANTAISIAQNIPSYVPKNGLVGWWPFNGNANDESGNGKNGTVTGATLTTGIDGKSDGAYNFNSSIVSQILCPVTNNIPNAFTVSMWVLPTTQVTIGNETDKCINSNSYELGFNTQNWALFPENGGNQSFGVGLSVGTNAIQVGEHGFNVLTCRMSKAGSYNQFKHIVLSYTQDSSFVYIDGVKVLSRKLACIATQKYLMTALRFGAQYSGGTNFSGKLDEISVFNRSLTQEEITGLFSRCSGTTATITPKSTTTFCDGASVELEANSGTNYTYQWFKNNQTINAATSVTYKATTTGKYTVIVTDGACSDTSELTNVTVNSNPSVSINSFSSVVYKSSNVIQLQGNPTGGTFTGSGVIGTNLDPSKIALGKRSVSYSFTTPEGCNGTASRSYILADTLGNVCSTYDTLKINFKLTTGIKANELTTVSAYPNPTSDVLFIEASDIAALNGYAYRIVDLQGKELYKKSVEKAITQISLNTLGAKGVYILHILDGNGSSVENKKIVLQ